MGKFVQPKVYLVGETVLNCEALESFLDDSDNNDFLKDWEGAVADGLGGREVMCSAFAKLCYASLSLGKNENVTRTRSIEDNIKAVIQSGHGSILEHVQFNFIIDNCSRVLTHELCRHRVGTAFSQTSGRYCRLDAIDLVFDPILEPVRSDIEQLVNHTEEMYEHMSHKLGLVAETNFNVKKKLTSALRRIAPNGQSNQIAFSANLRALRHMIMLRTARHAEWEIRNVFAQIYRLVKEKAPLFFYDAIEGFVDGEFEITGMKIQPFEAEAVVPTTN